MNIQEIIAKKRNGKHLNAAELRFIANGAATGSFPDYQLAAWLMAVYLQGMSPQEILELTLAMRDSGDSLDLSDLPSHPTLDKHSTGGVGDKVTLVLVPILAALGIPILKMSGRGLGFTGGTIDKLESIPNFNAELGIEVAKDQVARIGAAFIAQTKRLAPADKALYALRDVTATVDSLPLIVSSIMSKKLASGADCLLLDVKVGKGSFMKNREEAEKLAAALCQVGKQAGVATTAVLTQMEEPLGWSIGNALEVQEAIHLLQGKPNSEPKFLDLCKLLAIEALLLTKRATSLPIAATMVENALASGAAEAKFCEIMAAQGVNGDTNAILLALPRTVAYPVIARQEGVVISINAEAIGKLAMSMGAGRASKTDIIDASVGIVLHAKTGAKIAVGSKIASLYLRSADASNPAPYEEALLKAFRIEQTDAPPADTSLFLTTITA